MKDTPKHHKIYTEKVMLYDQLISREDYRGELSTTITSMLHLTGKDVLELGVGTGRLAKMVIPHCRSYYGYDAYPKMLVQAEEKLKQLRNSNWHLGVAEHKNIPLPNQSVDIVLSGWSLSYVVPEKDSGEWNNELKIVLREIQRILRKSGIILIIESLGTGNETARSPNARLERMYSYLENELAFTKTVIRTDYQFHNIEERNNLMSTFFNQEVMQKVLQNPSLVVPECTGLWKLEM